MNKIKPNRFFPLSRKHVDFASCAEKCVSKVLNVGGTSVENPPTESGIPFYPPLSGAAKHSHFGSQFAPVERLEQKYASAH